MKFIYLFIFIFSSVDANSQVDNTIMRSGKKLNLVSKKAVGSNATIAKYCDAKGRNCQEMLVTNNRKSIAIPVTSGPIYNIFTTGKTSNFTGMTKHVSTNKKLTQYYTISGNTQTIVTPIKKSFVISIYQFGGTGKGNVGIGNVFKPIGPNQGADDCKCLQLYEECYIDTSIEPTSSDEDIDFLLKEVCDEAFKYCKNECDKIVIENVQVIVVGLNGSTPNSFQIGIK